FRSPPAVTSPGAPPSHSCGGGDVRVVRPPEPPPLPTAAVVPGPLPIQPPAQPAEDPAGCLGPGAGGCRSGRLDPPVGRQGTSPRPTQPRFPPRGVPAVQGPRPLSGPAAQLPAQRGLLFGPQAQPQARAGDLHADAGGRAPRAARDEALPNVPRADPARHLPVNAWPGGDAEGRPPFGSGLAAPPYAHRPARRRHPFQPGGRERRVRPTRGAFHVPAVAERRRGPHTPRAATTRTAPPATAPAPPAGSAPAAPASGRGPRPPRPRRLPRAATAAPPPRWAAGSPTAVPTPFRKGRPRCRRRAARRGRR